MEASFGENVHHRLGWLICELGQRMFCVFRLYKGLDAVFAKGGDVAFEKIFNLQGSFNNRHFGDRKQSYSLLLRCLPAQTWRAQPGL